MWFCWDQLFWCSLLDRSHATAWALFVFIAAVWRRRKPRCASKSLVLTSGHYSSEQFDTLQFSIETVFREFFGYAAAVLSNGGHIYWEWPAKCIGWSSVELREFRAQQKSCGRELFMTACNSCFFAKREQSVGTSSLAISHTWSSFQRVLESPVSRKSRTRVETNIWRKENIHLQWFEGWWTVLFMISVFLSSTCFCLKLIVFYPHLPKFLLHHLLKKPKRIFPQRNVNVFESWYIVSTFLVVMFQRRFWDCCFSVAVVLFGCSTWSISCSVIRVSNPVTLIAGNASRTVAGGEGWYIRTRRFQ